MTQRKKWDPERMTATEAVRNKKMGSYKAFSVFKLRLTTLQSYVTDRQESSSKVIKQK